MARFTIILVLFFSNFLFSQTMHIHTKSGTDTYNLSDIDSITFTIQSNSSEIIYSEDFSNDPNFTSLDPEYAYWNSDSGYYYVITYDDTVHKSFAYSPEIFYDGNSDLLIEFDIMFENQDWGTYPGVHFYYDEPVDINKTTILGAENAYRDQYVKTICIYDSYHHAYYTDNNSIKNFEWYHIKIEYYKDEQNANLSVIRKKDGSIIKSFQNVDFIISSFRFIGVGFYNVPNYGNELSPIILDNIVIKKK